MRNAILCMKEKRDPMENKAEMRDTRKITVIWVMKTIRDTEITMQ